VPNYEIYRSERGHTVVRVNGVFYPIYYLDVEYGACRFQYYHTAPGFDKISIFDLPLHQRRLLFNLLKRLGFWAGEKRAEISHNS